MSVKNLQSVGINTLRAWVVLVLTFALIAILIDSTSNSAALLAVILLATYLSWLAQHLPQMLSEAALTRLGIIVLVIIAVGSFAWALLFSSNQGSDFGVYYRCGIDHQTLDACRSKYLDLGNLYADRSLVYTRFFGSIFGANYTLFKIFNATLHIIALTLIWVAARRTMGSLPGLVAVIAFGCSLERWYAITIATPDNMALVAIGGIFFLLSGSKRSALLSAVIGFTIGALMVAAEQLRNIGIFAATAILMWLILSINPVNWQRISIIVLGALVTFGSLSLAIRYSVDTPAPNLLGATLTSLEILHPLTTPSVRWVSHLWPAIPPELRAEVGLAKLATEISMNWPHFPKYFSLKADALFKENGYFFFATTDLVHNLDTQMVVEKTNAPIWLFAAVGRLSIAIPLTLALIGLIRSRRSSLSLLCLTFTSVVFGFILIFGEVQSRYALIVLPTLSILAGSSVHSQPHGLTAAGSRIIAGLSALLVSAALVVISAKTLADHLGYPILSAPHYASTDGSHANCDRFPASVETTPDRTIIMMPPETPCVAIMFNVPLGTRKVTFFVTRSEFLYPGQSRLTALPYEYTIFNNHDPVIIGTLGNETARWHSVELEHNTPQRQSHLHVVIKRDLSSNEAINVELANGFAWK